MTLRIYGWVVELFVQTPTSLEHYWKLEDFRGATDPAKLAFISSALVSTASELMLLLNSRWLGAGKWSQVIWQN